MFCTSVGRDGLSAMRRGVGLDTVASPLHPEYRLWDGNQALDIRPLHFPRANTLTLWRVTEREVRRPSFANMPGF